MRNLLAVLFLLVFIASFGVACVEFRPPAEGPIVEVVPPKPSPISTVTPTPTEIPPTPTPTSTVTPTPTETPTVTPTVPAVTPTVMVIPPFPPPFGLTPSGAPGLVAAPGETPVPPSWACNGDERMLFLPESPQVGQEVIITVTSAKEHPYFLLGGSEPFTQVGPGRGGPGFFWQWKKKVDAAGVSRFTFFSGPAPEHQCVTGEFLATGGTPTPTPTFTITPTVTPTATKTPTPTGTPRPDH